MGAKTVKPHLINILTANVLVILTVLTFELAWWDMLWQGFEGGDDFEVF